MNVKILLIGVVAILLLGCATEKEHLIKIETRYGDMYAILFDETPIHKQNFLELAMAGRFDSTEFHRIIENFMIQGGDVFTKEGIPANEWPTLPAEIVPGFIHSKGMIAAARQGDSRNPERRSNGSQFYIIQGKVYTHTELVVDMKLLQETFFKYIQLESQSILRAEYSRLYESQNFDSLTSLLLREKQNLENFFGVNLEKQMTPDQITSYTNEGGTPHLDGEYTVFGKVIKGLDVLDKIAAEKKDLQDKPLVPIHMKVSVEELNKNKITDLYGYEFVQKQEED